MKRAEQITQALAAEISSGNWGPSGSLFITVRNLAEQYHCSLHCALDVFQNLTAKHFIRKIKKKYYITTGRAHPNTELVKFLSNHDRPIYGVLLNESSNPFYAALVNQLDSIVAASAQQLVIACCSNDPKRKEDSLTMFLEIKCKGVFNCVPIEPGQESLFKNYPLPIVTLAEEPLLKTMDAIIVDNFSAGKQVAAHLQACGCRSFAYLSEKNYVEYDQRLKGFQQQLSCDQLPPENIGVITTTDAALHAQNASHFINDLLKRQIESQQSIPLGIFCVHDLLAVEVLRLVKNNHLVKKYGLRIPQDIMIVGFDNLPVASYVIPPLTTVSYQYSSMAKMAFAVMTDALINLAHRAARYEIDSALIVRETTLK